MGKEVSLIAFRQVLTKILPAACIQLVNHDLFEKARLKLGPLIHKTAGLSPRIIRQVSPFLPKMSNNCCTLQVWTVPHPSAEPLWETLGIGENPTQQPKIYLFLPSEKSHLIELNLSLSKVSFLPHQIAIFK